MPRVSANSTEGTPKRAPRRRVTEPKSEVSVASPVSRKAPTSVSDTSSVSRGKSKKGLYLALGILVVAMSAAAVIGYSDDGQININTVIDERNARVSSGDVREGESAEIIPVQNTSNLPDGGLEIYTGEAILPASAPVEEAATTTASSSEEVGGDGEVSADEENVVEADPLPASN